VGNLKFKATAHELAAIPKTASRFSGHDIHGTGDQANGPADNIVDLVKLHSLGV
jgi:hypothetical protein